jgi:hypothetical protein
MELHDQTAPVVKTVAVIVQSVLSQQVNAYRIRIDCIGARRDEESYAAEMLMTTSSNSPRAASQRKLIADVPKNSRTNRRNFTLSLCKHDISSMIFDALKGL